MATQQERKRLFQHILSSEVWKNDAHMVDYCVKKTAHIVELQSGDIVTIDRPRIEKDFCFGYSCSSHDTESFDHAQNMSAHARESAEYFMRQNLKGLDNMIALLDGSEHSRFDFYTGTHYIGQPADSKLKQVVQLDRWGEHAGYSLLSESDRAAMLEGYRQVRADFVKRLQTYLKRYGTSKVHSWTYWQDE